jgi:hypothetical protein
LILDAQEVSAATSGGFFAKVKDWFGQELWLTVIGIVGGILGNKGYNRKLKMVARKGSIYLKGLGHLFTDAGEALSVADNSIRDDDSIDAKGVLDAIKKGKNVYIEGKEFIVSVKPKI